MFAQFNHFIGQLMCKMVDHKRVEWHVVVGDGEVHIKREFNTVCSCCGARLIP